VEGGRSSAPTVAPSMSPAAESAVALDRAFQTARAAINAEGSALDTLPVSARRTTGYAQRFDALRRAMLHADSLRRARDRWRAKAARA
jgi:hypothetical protein